MHHLLNWILTPLGLRSEGRIPSPIARFLKSLADTPEITLVLPLRSRFEVAAILSRLAHAGLQSSDGLGCDRHPRLPRRFEAQIFARQRSGGTRRPGASAGGWHSRAALGMDDSRIAG